ncbi:MAG TPA: choice-of-anchor tandem repeat GloVer-containing protein [Candidatus Cybelea sp.]
MLPLRCALVLALVACGGHPPMIPVPASGAAALAERAIGAARGASFKDLYSFPGGGAGYEPLSPLIRDHAGVLYGTTYYGGKLTGPYCAPDGCGVVFKIDSKGKASVVHAFAGPTSDGQNPYAGLLEDAAGNLYGTTRNGGATGYGVVFKIDRAGKETLLHTFCRNSGCPDGATPAADLILDSHGNLYGTASYGGSTSGACGFTYIGCGVVFKLDKTGKQSVLYRFQGPPHDGRSPYGALLLYKGIFYGTTRAGGVTGGACGSSYFGCGTVFRLTTTHNEKLIHAFTGGAKDGGNPIGALVVDSSGNLYGTAEIGGTSNNGVVYEIEVSGKERVLHSFGGGPGDGQLPLGPVARDGSGNLYGTTELGGASGLGSVFVLKTTGHDSLLHSFAGSDGAYPNAGVIRTTGGTLYGSAYQGGKSGCTGGCGTVFKI